MTVDEAQANLNIMTGTMLVFGTPTWVSLILGLVDLLSVLHLHYMLIEN